MERSTFPVDRRGLLSLIWYVERISDERVFA